MSDSLLWSRFEAPRDCQVWTYVPGGAAGILGAHVAGTGYAGLGIAWRSSGEDSALSPPRAWVQSLVRELRSHKPRGRRKIQERKC